jgi:hypothetical protein
MQRPVERVRQRGRGVAVALAWLRRGERVRGGYATTKEAERGSMRLRRLCAFDEGRVGADGRDGAATSRVALGTSELRAMAAGGGRER